MFCTFISIIIRRFQNCRQSKKGKLVLTYFKFTKSLTDY